MRAALLASAVLVASLGLTACTPDAKPEVEKPVQTKSKTLPEPDPTTTDPDPTTEPSDPDPGADGGAITVVNAGFGPISYDDTMWWYAIVIDNPSDRLFSFADLTIEAIAADGTILDTGFHYLTILPGETAVTGLFFDIGAAEIDHLELTGPGPEDSEAAPAEGLGTFTVSEMKEETDDYSTTVTGIVSGTFAEDQENVSVTIIATDASGAIVGGGYTYVDRVPAEGRAQFEAWFTDPLPAGSTLTGYASP